MDTLSDKVTDENNYKSQHKSANELEMKFYLLCNKAMQKLLNEQSQQKQDDTRIKELTAEIDALRKDTVCDHSDDGESEWKGKYKTDVAFLNGILENKEKVLCDLQCRTDELQRELKQNTNVI
eukprot:354987_1